MALDRSLQPIIVAHVVWVDKYQGDAGTVRNVGHKFAAAGHEAQNSGEVTNFLPVNGRCYGYVPRFTPEDENGDRQFKAMRLEKLGARIDANKLNGVTVCWTATPKPRADRVIVGWYQDATAYRNVKRLEIDGQPEKWFYFSAPADQCRLIPADLRNQALPRAVNVKDRDGPGTDAFYYPRERVTELLRSYLEQAPAQTIVSRRSSVPLHRGGGAARSPDPEERSRVEIAAMEEVKRHLTRGNWHHDEVAKDKLGWDIYATRKNERNLRIEVKGLSGTIATVELTRNEYDHLLLDDGSHEVDRFVVAIVTEATDENRRFLQAFSVERDVWRAFDLATGTFLENADSYLDVTPVTAARCSVVLLPRRAPRTRR